MTEAKAGEAHTQTRSSATETQEPFIHRFQTSNHDYVYDVNTNRILQVDRVMWDVLGLGIGWRSTSELNDRLPQHSPDQIQDAARKCEYLYEKHNLFSSYRPEGMRRIDPRTEQSDIYERGLQQLIIELTQACNLRCRYCSFSEYYPLHRSYTLKTIDFSVARKGIDYFLARVADSEGPCLGFYGGEPLLQFDLMKRCMEYALKVRKGEPLNFAVTTNGTVMTREMAEFSADHSVALLISLDGPPQCHDKNRVFADGSPTSSTVLKTLDMIKSINETYYRQHVGINSVIAPNADLQAFFEFFKDHLEIMGNQVLVSSFVSGSNTDYWDENPPSQEWCDSFETLRCNYFQSVTFGDGRSPSKFLENLFRPDFLKIYRRDTHMRLPKKVGLNGCCIPGTRRLYLDCDGRFHMCERINNTVPIGDADTGIDPELVCGLVDKYRAISEEDCCNCWLVRFCSLCFAACVQGGEFELEYKRTLCDQKRRSFHESLESYCQIAETNPAAFKYMDDIVIR